MSEQRELIKPGGNPTDKATLQSYLQRYSREAIDAIINILRTTRNESLKMGAAKVIIDKSIPDVKAVEITGKDGQPFTLYIDAGHGFIPADVRALAASARGLTGGRSQIQSSSVAPQSEKDDNSDNGVDKTKST